MHPAGQGARAGLTTLTPTTGRGCHRPGAGLIMQGGPGRGRWGSPDNRRRRPTDSSCATCGVGAFCVAPRVLGRLIARWSSRRPAPDAASPWRDLLDALAGDACPACRRAGSAEERFRFAFLSESYTDPGVVADLSASRGFCPEHTRLLLRELEASWVLPGVYRTVVEAVLERWTRRPGEPPAGRCPICASRAGAVESWLRAFLLALEDRVVQRAYEGSAGLCVTHARAALALARGDAAKRIAEVLAGRLERRPGTADFAFPLAGPDPDAPVRAVLRSRLAGISARLAPCEEHRPLREGLAARLAVDACP